MNKFLTATVIQSSCLRNY